MGAVDGFRQTEASQHRGTRSPRIVGERVTVPRRLGGSCVDYVVDLDTLHQRVPRSAVRKGDALLGNAAAWLLRPDPYPRNLRVKVRFDLPTGIVAATGWPRAGEGQYDVGESVFRYLSHVALGSFSLVDVEVAGGVLRVARFPGALRVGHRELVDWIQRAGATAAQLSGRFPVDAVLVAVIPSGAGESPVAFGHAGRGGGASVMLLVRENASIDGLLRDWVAPHEFSHLMHPYVERSDLWLSEGLATYYQEVLRARVGAQSELEAWRSLAAGFKRGRSSGTGRTLREESAAVRRTHAYSRVYWSGAALVLLCDVAMRKRGASLDAALNRVTAGAESPTPAWSAQRLIAELERASGARNLSPLVNRYLELEQFPDLRETYRFLGVVVNGEGEVVELSDEAPGAEIRRSILGSRR